jgi:hypothetical protein
MVMQDIIVSLVVVLLSIVRLRCGCGGGVAQPEREIFSGNWPAAEIVLLRIEWSFSAWQRRD